MAFINITNLKGCTKKHKNFPKKVKHADTHTRQTQNPCLF